MAGSTRAEPTVNDGDATNGVGDDAASGGGADGGDASDAGDGAASSAGGDGDANADDDGVSHGAIGLFPVTPGMWLSTARAAAGITRRLDWSPGLQMRDRELKLPLRVS